MVVVGVVIVACALEVEVVVGIDVIGVIATGAPQPASKAKSNTEEKRLKMTFPKFPDVDILHSLQFVWQYEI